MRRVVLVFVGGGIGSLLRAALLSLLAPGGPTAPVLLVNLIGAFILGILFVLADETGFLLPTTRLFLVVGVLGGFTTFSTYIWGADLLLTGPSAGTAFDYLVASVGGGTVTVVAGLVAGRELVRMLETRGLRATGAAPHAGHPVDSGMLTTGNEQESA